jgi:membrane-bound lytic murein transglycosylase MltF
MGGKGHTGPLAAALACLALPASALAQAPAGPPSPTAGADARGIAIENTPLTGDLDALLERRVIRVVVPFSRSLYHGDRGQERGLSAVSVRGFERWLNERHANQLKNRPITVLIRPATRDRLLADVAAGLADVAVGNLTITAERLALVDFVPAPNAPAVNEVLVTGPASPVITQVDDLSGKTVHVRRASSYFESLETLNRRFAIDGRPAVNIVLVPDALEDEDLLEMLDAGVLQAIVVDDWKGRMWAQVLPHIRVNQGVVLRASGQIGWATRKGSPRLEAEILAYLKTAVTRGFVSGRLNQEMRWVKRMTDPTSATGRKRFAQTYALFEKYGRMYRFDPLMLTAQGYQESRLNQAARSPVGAVGVMQLMPETGKALRVGDIHLLEPNIHAGTKYMDELISRSFPDADFDEVNRTLFALASYNAGPGAIARMREGAERSGLDPNRWFGNVEIVTARKIGSETTTYVRNVYKYYAAYLLSEETQAEARRARAQWTPAPGKREEGEGATGAGAPDASGGGPGD